MGPAAALSSICHFRDIPILVGGDTDADIARAVRLADGYFPSEGDAERLGGLVSRLRAAAEQAGRDPDSIEVNVMFGAQMADPIAVLEQLRAVGVGRIMIPAFFFAGPGGTDRLEALAERCRRRPADRLPKDTPETCRAGSNLDVSGPIVTLPGSFGRGRVKVLRTLPAHRSGATGAGGAFKN